MTLPDATPGQPEPDARNLAHFIYELNISRRQLSTYPPGHPLIHSSTEKVLTLLDRLFEGRETISFGVSQEGLLFDRKWLNKKNPAFRDLAAALARLGIAVLSFHRKPQREELLKLNQILSSDRQAIRASGGFARLLAEQRVTHIEIIPVDYQAFQATEESRLEADRCAATLWEDFLSSLLTAGPDPAPGQIPGNQALNTILVADLLNRRFQQQQQPTARIPDYEQAVASFVRRIQQSDIPHHGVHDQFAELIGRLTPELRRQFLESALRHLDPAQSSTEAVLSKLPSEVILAILEDLHHDRLNLPTTLVRLLSKLSKHQQTGPAGRPDEQRSDQLKTIFQEEQKGKFTPESYQLTLSRIVSLEPAIALPEEDVSQLRRQFLQDSIERHNCAIIIRLLHPELTAEQAAGLQNNLIELARFFLESGDFKGLRYLHSGVLNYHQQHPQSPPEQTARLLATLTEPTFLEEILDHLNRWGDEKQQEIRAYIQSTGAAFADHLVRRLAGEAEMGLRRLYVNALADLGKAAHPAIYPRLADNRWFLVRNLLNVLRIQNDPIKLEAIYPLEKYPHLRVNQELLKLLFKFDRARADGLLLQQLASNDPALVTHAINLAELSRSPEISHRLLGILDRGRVTSGNLDLKLSIVRSLAAVGGEEALPTLEKLLFSGRWFPSARLIQLKLEIVRRLDNYPASRVEPLLNRLVRSRQRDLRRLAGEKLRQLTRNQP